MASYDPPIPPDNSSRQSPFSALPTLLMLSWQQVLMHHAVYSRVAEHHIINWKNGLSQDSSDTFAYWTRYRHDEPDGKECADTMLCAMQEMIDMESKSCRILRYILIKFAKTCNMIPSAMSISGLEFDGRERPAQGGFSDVYRGLLDGKSVAMKSLRVSVSSQSKLSKKLYREALLWRQMRHPCILPFLGLAELDQPYQAVYMVSPWMLGGSLYSLLRARPIELPQKASWIWQICDGLRCLHEMFLIHGDLRAANILLDAKNHAVIADFGLTQLIDAGDSTTSMSNRTGTIRWMAPEVIANEECTYSSDTYSFGCTSLEIFTQKDPFPELTEQREVRRRIIGGSNLQWPDSSTGIASFDRIGLAIRPCLERMPINRPSMEHVARELKAILVPENDEDGHSNVYDQTLLDEGNRSDLQVRDTQDAADLRESLDAIHLDMPAQTQSVEPSFTNEQAIDISLISLPLVFEILGYHQLSGSILQELRLKRLGYNPRAIDVHPDTRNPAYATVKLQPDVEAMDDELKLVCAEAFRQLSAIPVEDRDWEVVSDLVYSVMEPMSDIRTVDKTDFWLRNDSPLNASSCKDPGIVHEVEAWLKKLIGDESVWSATNLNFKIVAEIVTRIGGAIESMYDEHWSEKAVFNIGVMCFPDTTHPYFKVCRIKLSAWLSLQDNKFNTASQPKNIGIAGSYNYRQFQPRLMTANEFGATANERLAKAAAGIIISP